MDHEELLALYDRRVRRGAQSDAPDARIEYTPGVVRQSGSESAWNGVLFCDLDEGGADAAIAEQVRHYTALGRDFEWTHYAHDRPADLGARLGAAGFRAEDPETLMVAEIAALPAGAPAAGVRIEAVTDEAGIEQVVAVHEQAFGTDGSRLRRRLLAQLTQSPDVHSAYLALAEQDGRAVAVSAARLELRPGTGFAGLWGGGTLEAWRGRGVYRALIAHRARIAADAGYRYLQVDASSRSRPILQRLGFAALTTITPYRYEP
ncbi:GNAT family N-acetyltransferase [Kitasatospora sp. NPDC058170]|uniref:GNAT family N-acetyltransferase n=1 Tax=Kitasatospora sp. NPDC058170 TaxID=3346364 RepID=UPI0036DACD5D